MEAPITIQSLQAQAKAEAQTTRHRSNITLPKPVIVAQEADDDDHTDLPGPPPPPQREESAAVLLNRQDSDEDSLSLSATEHYRRGTGVLASGKDIFLPPAEFAAGCNLLQAAAAGDQGAMEILLEKNPSHVNFRDYDRRTAMHVAASEGHVHICRFLTNKGARINRSDRWGGSPLDDAHRHRHLNVVEFLRSEGATTGSSDQTTNLVTAAAEGDENELVSLLSVISQDKINEGDYDRRTALHLAAGEGYAGIVRILLEAGANPNAEDRWGGRPLDDAVRHDKTECVEVLTQYGAEAGNSVYRRITSSGSNLDNSISKSDRRREKDNLMVEFKDLDMIERIGSGAFGEIYKCRWRGTLVAAKCIKSAKIRRNWIMEQALNRTGSQDGSSSAGKDLDEMDEMSKNARDMALADFRQETAILRSLR